MVLIRHFTNSDFTQGHFIERARKNRGLCMAVTKMLYSMDIPHIGASQAPSKKKKVDLQCRYYLKGRLPSTNLIMPTWHERQAAPREPRGGKPVFSMRLKSCNVCCISLRNKGLYNIMCG